MFLYYALIRLKWPPSELYEFFKDETKDERFKILIKTLINHHIETENKETNT